MIVQIREEDLAAMVDQLQRALKAFEFIYNAEDVPAAVREEARKQVKSLRDWDS